MYSSFLVQSVTTAAVVKERNGQYQKGKEQISAKKTVKRGAKCFFTDRQYLERTKDIALG